MRTAILKSAVYLLWAALAAVVGAAATLWIASFSTAPLLYLSGGAVAYAAVYGLGARWFPGGRLWPVVGLAVLAVLTTLLLTPVPDPRRAPQPVDGMQYWELETGSRIAYVHREAKQDTASDRQSAGYPVVFLHGGPGVADMAGDARYFGRLTEHGHDVYVYDQIGSGHSARLADPRSYSVHRDLADLEAIRREIGVQKMILIGHSYGATLLANYMAAHTEHVSKAVFSAPADMDPEKLRSGDLTGRLDLADKLSIASLMLHPRVFLAYGLLQVDPLAAIAFAGDAEMDARFDRIYSISREALYCGDHPEGRRISGLGLYANQTPQSAWFENDYNPVRDLTGVAVPALIVKGRCDYLTWSSALDYRQALGNSSLVYFRDAGHNIYRELPEEFMNTLEAFLSDRSLPVSTYSRSGVPQDYQGPAGGLP